MVLNLAYPSFYAHEFSLSYMYKLYPLACESSRYFAWVSLLRTSPLEKNKKPSSQPCFIWPSTHERRMDAQSSIHSIKSQLACKIASLVYNTIYDRCIFTWISGPIELRLITKLIGDENTRVERRLKCPTSPGSYIAYRISNPVELPLMSKTNW